MTEIMLDWRLIADDKDPRWAYTRAVYAYLAPRGAEVLYIGKADGCSFRDRWRGKAEFWLDHVRNRSNMKILEGALEKLILLFKQPNEDPLYLEEYQELIKDMKSSRRKMMRRLVYDTFLRFFLGTTTRLEWTDAYRSLSLTPNEPARVAGSDARKALTN